MKINIKIEKESLPVRVLFSDSEPGDFLIGSGTHYLYFKTEEGHYNISRKVEYFPDVEAYGYPIELEIEVTP